MREDEEGLVILISTIASAVRWFRLATSKTALQLPVKVHAMKTRYVALTVGAALVTLSIGAAHGAEGDAASTPAADTSAGTTSKQQMRTEDHALAKSVRHALYKTKGLVSSGITVIAKNGVVSLDGTVPAQEQIALAGNTAQSVAGVTTVKNNVVLAEKN
jgi:hyperosmotically inducible periplasmic protein